MTFNVTNAASDNYEKFENLDVAVANDLATVRFKAATGDDFEHSFFTDLRDVFVPLGRDPRVRAVVFAVEPPPASTGKFGQIITTASLEQRAGRFLTIQQLFTELTTFRKPIVAGVSGFANGIIGNVALLSDAVIAADSATFGDSHVPQGIAAGDGGTALWPILVGPGMAKQILLEGRVITAQEALALGLVSRVVTEDELLDAAHELAGRLGNLPRVPYLSTKLAVNNQLRFAALLSSDLTAAYEAATVAEPPFATRHAG
jgi:enoyl-CoA hydratase